MRETIQEARYNSLSSAAMAHHLVPLDMGYISIYTCLWKTFTLPLGKGLFEVEIENVMVSKEISGSGYLILASLARPCAIFGGSPL